jgi:hypothetical protein
MRDADPAPEKPERKAMSASVGPTTLSIALVTTERLAKIRSAMYLREPYLERVSGRTWNAEYIGQLAQL